MFENSAVVGLVKGSFSEHMKNLVTLEQVPHIHSLPLEKILH